MASFLKLVFEKRPLVEKETPQVFFEHLEGDYAFLLESGKYGRYSYVGYDPFMICSSQRGVTRLLKKRDFLEWRKQPAEQIIEGEPLQVLRELFKSVNFKGRPPVPFFGGACGYFSYDFGVQLGGVSQKVFDDLELPDFVFSFVDKMIAFDHEKNELYFLALAETDLKGRHKIGQIKHDLLRPPVLKSMGKLGKIQSNVTSKSYQQKVAKIQQFLLDGETYQVNFSQRFTADCTQDPWRIAKKLFTLNPAPFSCYFSFPDFQIMSSSPELLLRTRGTKVETWPIKGTIARGAMKNGELRRENEEGDLHQIQTLLASEKDKAELSMIVDLERNDLGKVCVPGSVRVAAHRDVEKYSHVIHTVSRVEGRLAYGKDFFDAFEAVFPGGSITGCPKKRTMEIIDQLEDFKRGVYCGSAGFISFSGESDLNILIRTMLLKDGKIYFHSGGGIVVDSDPKKEYQETLDKVEALMLSLK